jgi:diguanylate cyclase (GGDEF)-like protein
VANKSADKLPDKLPDNESDRLEAVKVLGLMDTPGEERFDRFTRFAQRVFDVPVAYVSLINSEMQWFKSLQGVTAGENPLEDISRSQSICTHTLLEERSLVIDDLAADERFRGNSFVEKTLKARFYAGVQLRSQSGHSVGTLGIVDRAPREFSADSVQILKDLAEMIEQEFHTHHLATTDELTGLSNRRGFRAIAQNAIALCRRLDKAATLMFFDLDGFKFVNDNYGHAEGDKVLQDLGQMMLDEFRNSDVVARLGGDEFCVLLTGTAADDVEKPLENLSTALQQENRKLPYDIGYSVGTVAFDAEKHKSVDDLLMEADASMYREKKARKAEAEKKK